MGLETAKAGRGSTALNREVGEVRVPPGMTLLRPGPKPLPYLLESLAGKALFLGDAARLAIP